MDADRISATTIRQLISQYWVALLVTVIALRLVRNKFRPGLWKIPGPSVASYTNLWRLFNVARGQAHLTDIELHRKHGRLVRVGPKHVSVGDGKEIANIYSLKAKYTKTGFYPIQSLTWRKKNVPNLFALRDEAEHRDLRRPVANLYSLGTILNQEPSVDKCTELLTSKLSTDEAIDLGTWLHWYAFDVIGELTFNKPFGFLEEGKDVDNIIATNQVVITYMAVIGQVPELHPFLLGNPAFPHLIPQMEAANQTLVFALKAINETRSKAEQIHRDSGEFTATEALDSQGDFLSRLEAMKLKDPEKITTQRVISYAVTNIFAGADTTSSAMQAIFYLLLRNPDKMQKLVAEIDSKTQQGLLSYPIKFREAFDNLPYLNAVIKESLRLHPSIGLMLERYVPKGGAVICDQFLPEGTIVGTNSWVIGRDPEIYDKAEEFIPERWLEATGEKLRLMERNWFVFGAGSRTCIGQHISMMEMVKLIPDLLREFEIRLDDPQKNLKVWNAWFISQTGLIVRMKRRR